MSPPPIVHAVWGKDLPTAAVPVLRTYVSRLRKTLEPDRAADESRAVIVSAIDRYLAFAVPEVSETALAAIEAITRELIRTAPTAW